MEKFLMLFLIAAIIACKPIETTKVEQMPADSKVDSILSTLSIEQKVGQMTQIDYYKLVDSATYGENLKTKKIIADSAKIAELVSKYHIGSFLNGYAIDPEMWVDYINTVQRITLQHSKIPMIYGVDHVHGSNYISNGTIFPQEISLACSFNPELAAKMGEVTSDEVGALGHHWIFAPILDLGKQKFWPRLYETFGEDPYLASQMGAAYVKAMQQYTKGGYKVAACGKHYLGYSASVAGWDRSPSVIAPQELHEFYRASFQAAADAGLMTIMVNSGEINGTPVHASKEILTHLLRDQIGFKGVVVTDWEDIISLYKAHKIAKDEKEATYLAISAGIDMSMTPYTLKFYDYLLELVKEGRISEERINESVRRIIKLKIDLGLFENPFPTKKYITEINKPEFANAALEAARQSLVLIKNNENILPLDSSKLKILIAGPSATSKVNLSGGWTYIWQGTDESYYQKFDNVYQACSKVFDAGKIKLSTNLEKDLAWADVVVYVGGEEPYAEGFGSITDLDLDQAQQSDLLKISKSGKKSVFVLLEGRPRTFPALVDKIDAIVFAGLPGPSGANAIAEMLAGKFNPSGKMSISYPYRQGHMVSYHHKPTDIPYLHKLDDDKMRFWIAPFGHGLSYTTFAYSDFTLSAAEVTKGGAITASVKVKNTGKRSGSEAVLWYLSDEVRSITPPVKMLKHFEKITLNVGEEKTVTFEIKPEEKLWYYDANGEKVFESGRFYVEVNGERKPFELK